MKSTPDKARVINPKTNEQLGVTPTTDFVTITAATVLVLRKGGYEDLEITLTPGGKTDPTFVLEPKPEAPRPKPRRVVTGSKPEATAGTPPVVPAGLPTRPQRPPDDKPIELQ